jgi:hypothetical protein
MSRTLKERYKTQQLQLLRERAHAADLQLLQENRAATLLVEAMNEEDLNKVTAIIQKLSSIKSPQLPKLTAAIEQAEAEINKYTAGGPLVKAWAKLKDLVGVDNPIVKVTTFANALERGFSQVPTILKNNGIDLQGTDLTKSLADTVTNPTQATGTSAATTSTATGTATTAQNEADVPVEGKLKNIVAQLQKALSPGGIFGAFKKVPYISSQALAQELVQAPLNVFSQVAKKIQAGAKAADIAPDLKAQVAGGGQEQTKHTGPETPSRSPEQAQPTTPGKPTIATMDTKPPGEHPEAAPGTKRGGGGDVKSGQDPKKMAFQRLKDAGSFKKVGLNDASAEALLTALEDIGALKVPE